jgi:hypothetical protein
MKRWRVRIEYHRRGSRIVAAPDKDAAVERVQRLLDRDKSQGGGAFVVDAEEIPEEVDTDGD